MLPTIPWLGAQWMHFGHLKRREFITLLGGTAAWPLAAGSQQPAMPVVGFLSLRSENSVSDILTAFRQGLGETGYFEGRNVAIEYRWASNQIDRLQSFIIELIDRPVSVIAAFGTVPALTAKATSSGSIPIVFLTADDPVAAGIVANFNRPDGNITGVTFASAVLGTKRLELLRTLVPRADIIGLLVDRYSTESQNQAKDIQEAARVLAQELFVLNAVMPSEISAAFEMLVQKRASALLVSGSPGFSSTRNQLAELATRHSVPTMYSTTEYSKAGGLISYGASITDSYRHTGIYVGRLLKGDRPSQLPVMQPTKFELVINLKTARALNLEIPAQLLALADEVIE
jgi:ABC-type uncharacterized transport system substrate-binding protein